MDRISDSGSEDGGSNPFGCTAKIMYYAYVIKSLFNDYYYKGHCRDLQTRLSQHNAGKTTSIKNKIPFKLVYFEVFETLEEAVKREKYFKTAAGRKYLKGVIPTE